MKITTKPETVYTIFFIWAQVIFWFANQLGLSESLRIPVTAFWFIAISAYVVSLTNHMVKTVSYRNIIILSYFVKLALLTVNLLRNQVLERLITSDAIGFRNVSLMYYQGDFSESLTLYPYILAFQYDIFGSSYFIAVLVNVMLFTLGAVYMVKTVEEMGDVSEAKDSGNIQIWVIIVTSAPYILLYSVFLLRESIYFFISGISFYFFTRYVLTRRMKFFAYALLFTMPMVLLHQGNIAVTICYFFGYFEINKDKGDFLRVSAREILGLSIIIIAGAALQILIFSHGSYLALGTTGGIFRKIISAYRAHFAEHGGSRYLNWMRTPSNWVTLLLLTPLRMFYFLFAPLPTNWRGLRDIASFLLDSTIHIYSYYCMHSFLTSQDAYQSQEIRVIAKTAFYITLGIALIFSWGTATAGSAIRHRLLLIPIETCICALHGVCVRQQSGRDISVNYKNWKRGGVVNLNSGYLSLNIRKDDIIVFLLNCVCILMGLSYSFYRAVHSYFVIVYLMCMMGLLFRNFVFRTRPRWIILGMGIILAALLFREANHGGYGSIIVLANFFLSLYVSTRTYLSESLVKFICLSYVAGLVYWTLRGLLGYYHFHLGDYYNPNTIGLMGLMGELYGMIYSKFIQNKFQQIFFVLLLLSMAYQLQQHIVKSRACFVSGLLFALLTYLLPKRILLNKAIYSIMILAITLGSLLWTRTYVYLFRITSLRQAHLWGKKLFSGRQAIWTEMWKQIPEKWLTGVGTSYQFDAHNSMLHFIFVYGLPIFCCVLIAIWIKFYYIWKITRANLNYEFSYVGLCAMLSLFIYAFVEVPFNSNFMGSIFTLMVLVNRTEPNEPEERKRL